jgi:hypothetical protein
MSIAAAKPPGLITTFLISQAHFEGFWILISHNHDWSPPPPQCFLYTTVLMLLHVIKCLWSHQSIPMMGGVCALCMKTKEERDVIDVLKML